VSSGNNTGCALYDLAENPPREVWRNKNLKTPMCGAVLWQGYLYGFNDSDSLCVEWETGALKWALRDVRRGTLLIAEGNLIALSENGALAVAPATPEGFRRSCGRRRSRAAVGRLPRSRTGGST
jgi:hypothetical protein